MVRIVVLDGYTLNPGDLSWEGLEALGSCTVYERTAPEATVVRAQGAEIVITNKTENVAAFLAGRPQNVAN